MYMANVSREEIQRLAQRYEQLRKDLQNLGGNTDGTKTELFTIIHRPGWTTVLDVALVHQALDVLQHQTAAIEKLHEAMTAGARNGLEKSAAA
jgi:prefoldin subunit 5